MRKIKFTQREDMLQRFNVPYKIRQVDGETYYEIDVKFISKEQLRELEDAEANL